MWAKTESKARSIEEAFLKSLQQPVSLFLSHRSIGDCLLDPRPQFVFMRGLDGILYILQIYTGPSGYFLKSLSTLQRGDEFIGRHIKSLRRSLQFHQTETAPAPWTASVQQRT